MRTVECCCYLPRHDYEAGTFGISQSSYRETAATHRECQENCLLLPCCDVDNQRIFESFIDIKKTSLPRISPRVGFRLVSHRTVRSGRICIMLYSSRLARILLLAQMANHFVGREFSFYSERLLSDLVHMQRTFVYPD